jgi:hypothetical protein
MVLSHCDYRIVRGMLNIIERIARGLNTGLVSLPCVDLLIECGDRRTVERYDFLRLNFEVVVLLDIRRWDFLFGIGLECIVFRGKVISDSRWSA